MAAAFNNTGTRLRLGSSPTSDAFSVTAGGSNLCAFATIAYDKKASLVVTGVTYGGVTMTSCGATAENATGEEYVQIFYLTTSGGLLTGSNTLAVTISGFPDDIYVNLVSFSGVDQTTPVRPGTYQTLTGTTNPLAITITSQTGDMTLTCIDGGGGTVTSTDQTSDGINNNGSYCSGSDNGTGAATVTHTWTCSGATNKAVAGFSIQAAATGVFTNRNTPGQTVKRAANF